MNCAEALCVLKQKLTKGVIFFFIDDVKLPIPGPSLPVKSPLPTF